jgi:hypothetical protein
MTDENAGAVNEAILGLLARSHFVKGRVMRMDGHRDGRRHKAYPLPSAGAGTPPTTRFRSGSGRYGVIQRAFPAETCSRLHPSSPECFSVS